MFEERVFRIHSFDAVEPGRGQVHAFELMCEYLCLVEIRSAEVGGQQRGAQKSGSSEVAGSCVDFLQISSLQVGSFEVAAAQVGSVQPGSTQDGAAEVDELCLATAQVNAGQVEPGQGQSFASDGLTEVDTVGNQAVEIVDTSFSKEPDHFFSYRNHGTLLSVVGRSPINIVGYWKTDFLSIILRLYLLFCL